MRASFPSLLRSHATSLKEEKRRESVIKSRIETLHNLQKARKYLHNIFRKTFVLQKPSNSIKHVSYSIFRNVYAPQIIFVSSVTLYSHSLVVILTMYFPNLANYFTRCFECPYCQIYKHNLSSYCDFIIQMRKLFLVNLESSFSRKVVFHSILYSHQLLHHLGTGK